MKKKSSCLPSIPYLEEFESFMVDIQDQLSGRMNRRTFPKPDIPLDVGKPVLAVYERQRKAPTGNKELQVAIGELLANAAGKDGSAQADAEIRLRGAVFACGVC